MGASAGAATLAIPTPSLRAPPSARRSKRPLRARDHRLLPLPAPPLAGAARRPAPGAGPGGGAALQALRVDGRRHDDLRPLPRAPALRPRAGPDRARGPALRGGGVDDRGLPAADLPLQPCLALRLEPGDRPPPRGV